MEYLGLEWNINRDLCNYYNCCVIKYEDKCLEVDIL